MKRQFWHVGAFVLSGALVCGLGARAAERGGPAVLVAAASTEPEAAGTAEPKPTAEIPNCARKVKVVYSGYGEADRASCAAHAIP